MVEGTQLWPSGAVDLARSRFRVSNVSRTFGDNLTAGLCCWWLKEKDGERFVWVSSHETSQSAFEAALHRVHSEEIKNGV